MGIIFNYILKMAMEIKPINLSSWMLETDTFK